MVENVDFLWSVTGELPVIQRNVREETANHVASTSARRALVKEISPDDRR